MFQKQHRELYVLLHRPSISRKSSHSTVSVMKDVSEEISTIIQLEIFPRHTSNQRLYIDGFQVVRGKLVDSRLYVVTLLLTIVHRPVCQVGPNDV